MQEFVLRHKDGSLWARGQAENGVSQGYWEWFRKDGSKMRSGFSANFAFDIEYFPTHDATLAYGQCGKNLGKPNFVFDDAHVLVHQPKLPQIL